MSKQIVRPTAFALAFIDAAVKNPQHPKFKRVEECAIREKGMVKEKGWNARLSFHTAQKLQAVGVL